MLIHLCIIIYGYCTAAIELNSCNRENMNDLPQSLKYLQSDPFQKMSVDPYLIHWGFTLEKTKAKGRLKTCQAFHRNSLTRVPVPPALYIQPPGLGV